MIVRVPGRVNLIGEHIDYNGGPVMPMIINRYVTISAEPSNGDKVWIFSSEFQEECYFGLGEVLVPKKHWSDYCKGVAKILVAEKKISRGLKAIVKSNLPVGAGLGSSAAFEVAFARTLLLVNNITMPPLTLAKLCQKAEKEFVGVQCGLMDQVASVFGQKGKVIYFDTQKESIDLIPFPEGYEIEIIFSGKKRALANSAYNLRRQECQQALTIIKEKTGLGSFSQINLSLLSDLKQFFPPPLYLRARHVVEEIDRTKRAAQALKEGNMVFLGLLMNQSHQSLSRFYQTSTSEIDKLVCEIRMRPGVLGARLTGAGFGGYIIALKKKKPH